MAAQTAKPPQTYATHRRFVPLYHYVTAALLAVYLVWSVWRLIRGFGVASLMQVLLSVALVLLFYYTRGFPLAVQDRVIRLEMRLRLTEVLPPDLASRILEITPAQLIGLRFASNAELPGLVREVLDGTLNGREEIKKKIRDWQPDEYRA